MKKNPSAKFPGFTYTVFSQSLVILAFERTTGIFWISFNSGYQKS